MNGATCHRAVLAADLPKVTDWMQAWEGLTCVLVSALAVAIRGLMPPRNCKPDRRLTNVGYFDVNETAPHQSQLPEAVIDPVTATVYKRPAKWT